MNNWQTEFDEEFHFADAENEINIAGSELARKLKDHITSLLSKEREAGRNDILKEYEDMLQMQRTKGVKPVQDGQVS